MQIQIPIQVVMDGHFLEEQQEDILWYTCTILQDLIQVQQHQLLVVHLLFYLVIHGLIQVDIQKLVLFHQIVLQ